MTQRPSKSTEQTDNQQTHASYIPVDYVGHSLTIREPKGVWADPGVYLLTVSRLEDDGAGGRRQVDSEPRLLSPSEFDAFVAELSSQGVPIVDEREEQSANTLRREVDEDVIDLRELAAALLAATDTPGLLDPLP